MFSLKGCYRYFFMLNKKTTEALHGIAILMMIYHHLFIGGNALYVNEGKSLLSVFNFIDLTGSGSAQLGFAWFCKLCVAIFAFTSGYALFLQLDKKGSFKDMLRYVPKRLWSFYRKYLLAFLFFVGCSFFMARDSFDFGFSNFILSLLGLKAGYNSTWWYVPVYYLMVILSPFIYVLLKKINMKAYLAAGCFVVLCLVISLASGNLMVFLKFISNCIQNNTTIYLLIFAEGMFCARYGLIDKIGSKFNPATSLIVLVAVYALRSKLIRDASDPLFDLVLITPYIISMCRIFSYSDGIEKFFGYFGRYSAYMWYAHAYFYAYLFFIYVVNFDLSLMVYVQVVLYSLACAIVFTEIERKLFSRKKKSL